MSGVDPPFRFGGQSLIVELVSESQLRGRDPRRVPDENRAGGPELNEVLWRWLDQSFPYLRHLDEYGTTVFNGLQMVEVLPELERLAATDPESRVMKRVVELAQRCIDEQPHVFLVFLGD